MKKSTLFILFLSICQLAHSQQKQDTTALVQVESSDGILYVGNVISQDGEKITIATEKFGSLTFIKVDVKITAIARAPWPENPLATHYFFSPNGFGLKKGEAYYTNVWVLFNQFSVGINKTFSIGGGALPFIVGGPVWITPKFSIPIRKDRVSIGVGGLFVTKTGEDHSRGAILYGLTTFGSRSKNLTLGLGWGYSDGKLANKPTISISGLIQTSAYGYFIFESYYITTGSSSTVLLSLGGRRIVKRTGLDLGLFIPIQESTKTFVGIPWVGVTVPLHKKKM